MVTKQKRVTRALLSGGASGIGLAIAEALASQGVELVLASRRQGLLELEAARLSALYGVRVLPLVLDVSDGDKVQAQHAQARILLGPIDLLVNNSGMGSDHLVQDLPESEWDRVMDTCAKGTFLLKHQGIRVHTLCPSLVQEPPPACQGERKPGWLQVEDLADAVLYTQQQ